MNINKNLENIANKVLVKVNPSYNQDNCGSVILILTVISIILSLIRVIQECNKNKLTNLFTGQDKAQLMTQEINNICLKRNILTKWRLSRIVKQKLSPGDYKVIGSQLQQAIMDVGCNLTEEECLVLLEELNNV